MSNISVRFLYVTDIHNRSDRDQPKNRTDNYYRSVLAKQEEIGQILEDKHVDCLLFGGDLFHHFDPPMSLVNDVAQIWKTYKAHAIIGVIGSHDYNGYQVQTLRRTGVGNFQIHDLMTLVGNDGSIFPPYLDFEGVLITGTPHSADLVNDPKNFETAVKPTVIEPRFVIQLVHGDLFTKRVQWPVQTIGSVERFITADMVLVGHIHCGWENAIMRNNGWSTTGKTAYVNPGSIGRTSIGAVRPIQVYMFDVVYDEETKVPRLGHTEFIRLKNVVEQPFTAASELPEGPPASDFASLMKMISTMELKPSEFRQQIPRICEELFGQSSYFEDITARVFEILDEQEGK